MFHKIPPSVIINGFKFDLKPVDTESEAELVMGMCTIFYVVRQEGHDYMVSEIFGHIFQAMLDMAGIMPTGRGKKINCDASQLLKVLQHNMFCFLRDNPVDWRMVALNTPLLEEIIEPIVEKKHDPPENDDDDDDEVSMTDEPSLDATTSQALEEISRIEYDDPGSGEI